MFFDVEKAYDMVWKEGLMIKLDKMGITGINQSTFNWIKNYLFDRYIQVKMGTTILTRYKVDNGTPHGSVISPILFSIMINDVYSDISADIGRSLFADDGALTKE